MTQSLSKGSEKPMPKKPNVSTEEMLRRLSKGSAKEIATLNAMPDVFKPGEGVTTIPDYEDKAAGFAKAPKQEEDKPMTQKEKNAAALNKAMNAILESTKEKTVKPQAPAKEVPIQKEVSKSIEDVTKELEESGRILEAATKALEVDPTSAQARAALDTAIEKHEQATNAAIESLGEAQKAIGREELVEKVDDGADIHDGHMEICKVDESKRMVYGVFLWPAEADHDGDVISADDIEKVAHGFMKDYRDIDEMHGKEVIDANIVESAIAWDDNIEYHGMKLKKGAWFGAVYVTDEAVWQKVKNGSYKGFSVRISGVREPIQEGG